MLLFPGSRPQEFDRMYRVLVAAARLVRERFEHARFVVGLAPLVDEGSVRVPPDMRSFVRASRQGVAELGGASLVLAASGTVTLQSALSGTPMVVSYRMSPFTYAVGKLLVKIPWIAMPNVLSGCRIVPELIQSEATPERIAEEAISILSDPDRYRSMSADLISLRSALGGPGGMRRIAEIALRMARGEDPRVIASSPGEGAAIRPDASGGMGL